MLLTTRPDSYYFDAIYLFIYFFYTFTYLLNNAVDGRGFWGVRLHL